MGTIRPNTGNAQVNSLQSRINNLKQQDGSGLKSLLKDQAPKDEVRFGGNCTPNVHRD